MGNNLTCRAYRGLYIINWIYRYFTEDHFTRWIGKQCFNKEAPNYILHYLVVDIFAIFQLVCPVLSKLLSMRISSTTTT